MNTITASTNRLGNRSNNQDRCIIVRDDDKTLLAVADGMGGHARGELAAQTAIDSFTHAFNQTSGQMEDPVAFLSEAIQTAHREILLAGQKEIPSVDPRTVCVLCILQNNHAWWAHVGDSRLYHLRFDQVVTRTRDHTPLESLLAKGEITEEMLNTHPLRNSVSRCLGGQQSKHPQASFGNGPMKSGDVILLCSDGLWSALPERKLSSLNAAKDLSSSLDKLAEEAENNSYPSSDNICAAALRWFENADTGTQDEPHAQNCSDGSADPLQSAIDDIHRALIDYGDEMES